MQKTLYETFKSMYSNEELLVPDQNDESLWRNAKEIEREMFRKFRRRSLEDYHDAISNKAQDACKGFFAINGRPGTKRWCIEDGELSCKQKGKSILNKMIYNPFIVNFQLILMEC